MRARGASLARVLARFDGLRPPSHFSLFRQRKLTQRKTTRVPRPRCARVRVGPPGFSDGTSLCRRKTRALPARDTACLVSGPPPLHDGTRDQERSRGCAAIAVTLDLALGSRRWRRAAQPDGGERRRCLRPWMAEFGAGRRPASSAGNRSGFIGPAPASGVPSLYLLPIQ